jgi:hypothetical protein
MYIIIYDACDGYCDIYDACCDLYDACDGYCDIYVMYMVFVNFGREKQKKNKKIRSICRAPWGWSTAN